MWLVAVAARTPSGTSHAAQSVSLAARCPPVMTTVLRPSGPASSCRVACAPLTEPSPWIVMSMLRPAPARPMTSGPLVRKWLTFGVAAGAGPAPPLRAPRYEV